MGDSDADFTNLVGHLRAANYWVAAAHVDTRDALATALGERWELVITGWEMTALSGLDALQVIGERAPELPCIVFAPPPGESAIVTAIHAGAADFVSRDRPEQIVDAIERAFSKLHERRTRAAAERELRVSEARFRAGFEVAPEALLTYDYQQARIIEANPAAVALFGYSVDELRAMKVGELSSPMQGDIPVADASAAVIARARAAAGRVEPYEWTFRSKAGADLPCEARMVRLPTAGLDIARISIVDMRPRRRLEELRARAIELETQNRRIQEANRLKSEFLANMSHELRTPLNAIIGFTELLFDGQVPPEAPQHHEFLGDILTSGRHLLQLINDVLDLAKVEAGKLDFRPEAVDLSRLVGEVASILRTIASARRIVVELDVDRSIQDIVVDPNRFKQIAYNYLSNALKFTPEGGRITVRVLAEDVTQFRLEVEDTG
nr:histidine kinase dimerization/phospho-acceptor domain-containing protein [Kofleriaceae bacterium]